MLIWRRLAAGGVALTLAGLAVWPVAAQTINVTTSRDVKDIPANATINDLPGPDGVVSFNEALLVSDNTPGHQIVGFAIPEHDWWLSNIYPGQVLLQSTFGWSAHEPVTIDGTTQTAFTGDTFSGGNEMALDGLALYLGGDGSQLLGFHGSRIGIEGSNCEIYGNTGGMYISLAWGSGSSIHDNEADTIAITNSDDNLVIRNTTERVRISGTSSIPASGNRIGGPDPANRNYITGWGNVGEHGSVHGDTVELFHTDDTLIQNNYIGTTPDGMSIGNFASTAGIAVHNDNHNLMIRDNLIAIQAHWGGGHSGPNLGTPIYLQMYLGGSNIQILGNTLGLNALGDPVLGGKHGIVVDDYGFEYGADNIRIGGPNPGEGNIIAGHESTGVLMYGITGIPPVGAIRLSGNSIYDNGEFGIDLMPNTWDFGHTPNDPLDADIFGANELQNHPDIVTAVDDGQSLQIGGNLHSEPQTEFTLEFFASPDCDPSGFGQGQTFLGSTSVVTDAAGNAAFEVTLSVSIAAGSFVSATATREPEGATSEFSACLPVQSLLYPPESFDVSSGDHVSGTLADLQESDDADVILRSSLRGVPPVSISVQGTSPAAVPASLQFVVEASVKARSPIVQYVELFNYDSGQWEQVHMQPASGSGDVTTVVTAAGDISRFVENGTNRMEARCIYEARRPGRQFVTGVDRMVWVIEP
jgi:hypothetical protein